MIAEDGGGAPDAAAVLARLQERARRLARAAAKPPPVDTLAVVSFRLGRERYALESRFVQEVFRLDGFTPLPGAPAPLAGLTTRRGELLTLVDVRPLLGLPAAAPDELRRVLVLGPDHPLCGVLIDEAEAVSSVALADLRPPPEGSRAPLRGVADGALGILDADELLQRLDMGDAR